MARTVPQDGKVTKPAANSGGELSLWAQGGLVLMVVIFGDGNLVAKQIAAKTLGRFDYILGLVSAASYVVFYWAILGGLVATGSVKDVRGQMRWVWCEWSKPLKWLWSGPVIQLFFLAAIGDSVG